MTLLFVAGGLEDLPLSPKRCMEEVDGRELEIIQIGPTNLVQDDFILSISIVSIFDITSAPSTEQGKFKLALTFLDKNILSSEFNEFDCTQLIEDKWTFVIR